MNKVSAAELKARLGKYLGMVREGETVYVTSHRRTVAQLAPSQIEDSTGICPPTLPMSCLKKVKGVKSAAREVGLTELLADRRRR